MLAANMPTTVIPFRQAVVALQTRRTVSLDQAVSYLLSARTRWKAAAILRHLAPARYASVKGQPSILVGYLSDDPFFEAALLAIHDQAPLDLDFISTLIDENGPIEYLYPECAGYPFGWDDWEDLSINISGVDPNMALYMFVTAMRLSHDSVLTEGEECFGWDLDLNSDASLPDIDWDRLYDLLDQHDLSVFKNAIRVCISDTGNPYFDYNPYDSDQAIPDLPEFSIPGVDQLCRAWYEAQPILTDLRIAVDRFHEDPGLARVLFMLCEESQVESQPGAKPRTLVELWTSQGELDD